MCLLIVHCPCLKYIHHLLLANKATIFLSLYAVLYMRLDSETIAKDGLMRLRNNPYVCVGVGVSRLEGVLDVYVVNFAKMLV